MKDDIFTQHSQAEDFEFNTRVAEVFEDMLDRSVPFYADVIKAGAQILDRYLSDDDAIYDLGSSTGTTLLELSRLLAHKNLHYVGIDSSQAMLEKAHLKAELYSKNKNFTFLDEDITAFEHRGAGAVLLNYTLQFIRPIMREELIKKVYDSLKPGGVLLLSEKTICPEKKINRAYIDIYHNFKKERGYSELEISRKREALENVLIPFSTEENKNLLRKAGFTITETYFQWFNFASIVAIK